MADEDIYRFTKEGKTVLHDDTSQAKETGKGQAAIVPAIPPLDAGLVAMEMLNKEVALGGSQEGGERSVEMPESSLEQVRVGGEGGREAMETGDQEGEDQEPDMRRPGEESSRLGGRHPTVLDPRQSVQLWHCEDEACGCGGKVHCPFCNVQHYKPSRPARVRDHLTLLHFLHAVQFQDVLVVKCFHDCQHPAGHYHCPVCPSQILKRVAFAHHLRSHLNKLGKSLKDVRTPNHKQVDKILFDGVEIPLCSERCTNALGRHYHCPFCRKVNFSELGPMMSHVWRCREGQRGEGRRTQINQTWSALSQIQQDLPPPRVAFPDHWHKSVVRGVQDLETARCSRADCCGKKFHCALCVVEKFKPAFVRHLKAHYLAHWRNRVPCKGYSILVCYDNCESSGLPVRFHFHCPLCGVTRRRKQAMLNHLQACGRPSDDDTAVSSSEAALAAQGSEGSDDNEDDIDWPDDDDDDIRETNDAERSRTALEVGDGEGGSEKTPAGHSGAADSAASSSSSADRPGETTQPCLLTAAEVRQLEVFLPVTASLSPALVAAITTVAPSVEEFCQDVCVGGEVALTSSPGTLEPVFALTGSLANLASAQGRLRRKLLRMVSGLPVEEVDQVAIIPRKRGRPPKPKLPSAPGEGGEPPAKRRVGRPRRQPREDPDFSPQKPSTDPPTPSSPRGPGVVAMDTDSDSRRYRTRGIKRDYSALESGRLFPGSAGEQGLAAADSAAGSTAISASESSSLGNLGAPVLPRRRGRPRKTPLVSDGAGGGVTRSEGSGGVSSATQTPVVLTPRRRGRPRKMTQVLENPPSVSAPTEIKNSSPGELGPEEAPSEEGDDDNSRSKGDDDKQDKTGDLSEENQDFAGGEESSGEESCAGEDLPSSRTSAVTPTSSLSTAIFPPVCVTPLFKAGRLGLPPQPTTVMERSPSLQGPQGARPADAPQQHQCPGCSQTSQSFEEMRQHLAAEHPALEGQRCDVCEVVLASPDQLELHLRAGHGPRALADQHVCSACGEACPSLSALRWHQTYSHGQPLVCQTCQHQSATPLQHRVHKRQHRKQPPQCSVCGKVLGTLANLKIHMQAQHSHLRHLCPVSGCGKVFRHARYLSAHMRRHTASKSHTCPTCGRSFACANTLNAHLETHKDVKERRFRFICPYCAAQYRNKSNFQDHLNKHTGERPHKCPLCDKTFGFRSQLVKHKVFIHDSERPFQCAHCPRAFKFQRLLNQHSVLHTQVSPHTCQHCHKPYSCAATLKAHYPRCRGDRTQQQTVPAAAAAAAAGSVQTAVPAAVVQTSVPALEKTVVIEMQDGAESIVNISGLEMLQEHTAGADVEMTSSASQVYLCGICNQVFEELNAAGEHIATAHTTDASSEIELKLETSAPGDFQPPCDPFPPPPPPCQDASSSPSVEQAFLPSVPL